MVSSEQIKKIHSLAVEASSWTNAYLRLDDLEFSLRSPELSPNAELWDYVTADQNKQQAVSLLSEKRSRLIDFKKIKLEEKLHGRILCFYPEMSLKDAVVCLSSSAFIDQDDSPPWDTWIFYSLDDSEQHHDQKYSCLYSWVPNELVDMVNEAIKEDTYDCLIWAEQLERKLNIS